MRNSLKSEKVYEYNKNSARDSERRNQAFAGNLEYWEVKAESVRRGVLWLILIQNDGKVQL